MAERKAALDVMETTEQEQRQERALVDNLENIELLAEALMRGCQLLRMKRQLVLQVDYLSRRAADLQVENQREAERVQHLKDERRMLVNQG